MRRLCARIEYIRKPNGISLMTGKFSIKSLCVCATDGGTKKENNASVHNDIMFELNFNPDFFTVFVWRWNCWWIVFFTLLNIFNFVIEITV